MMDLGDVPTSHVVRFMFPTNLATGARTDPSSAWEAADLRVYKNGSVTQRASEAGYTVTSTFDSMTGITLVAIDTGDNTDAGFYAAGGEYDVVLYPDETVDGVAVSSPLAHFAIERTGGALALLKGANGVAAIKTETAAIKAKTDNLPSDPADQSLIIAATTSILADTDDIQTRLPAALNSGRMDSSVGAKQVGLALTAQEKADVNAEVLDVVNVDTFAEPTGVPAATTTLAGKLGRLYQALRNKVSVTATKKTFTDDSEAAIWEKDVADDGTTYSESEGNAP